MIRDDPGAASVPEIAGNRPMSSERAQDHPGSLEIAQGARPSPMVGKERGSARVAFVENLPAIRAGLAEGRTAKAVYLRHADTLAGRVSYPQFVRYVRRLLRLEAIAPLRHSAAPDPVSARRGGPVVPAPLPLTAPPRPAATRPDAGHGGSDARHESSPATPAGRPGFRHDPRTKEGEPEQLLGPDFLGERRR